MKNFERLIPITIKEAKIQSISIDYRELKLKVAINVGLITEDKQILTSISVSNNEWQEEKNLTIPVEVSELAGQLESILRIAIIQHMNKYQRKLEAKDVDA